MGSARRTGTPAAGWRDRTAPTTGAGPRTRGQEAGEHEQHQAEAVDADVVLDAERRNPWVALDELERRRRAGGIEPPPQQERDRERHHRDGEREVANEAILRTVAVRDE